jgi:hypothetical protein
MQKEEDQDDGQHLGRAGDPGVRARQCRTDAPQQLGGQIVDPLFVDSWKQTS